MQIQDILKVAIKHGDFFCVLKADENGIFGADLTLNE